jgi:hypothetical protein
MDLRQTKDEFDLAQVQLPDLGLKAPARFAVER